MTPHKTDDPSSSSTRSSLPQPNNNDAVYVHLSALHAGHLTLPEHFFCATTTDNTILNTILSLSFLIHHPPSSKSLVFDLGMRRNLSAYPPEIQPHLKTRQPIFTEPDAAESLRVGGLSPEDVDAVVFSHVHYDHVSTPGDFGKAVFVVGPGTKRLLTHGMKCHSAAHFERDLLSEERTVELPEPGKIKLGQGEEDDECFKNISLESFAGKSASWKPLPPFEHVIDFFGDNSVYIVNSPGHMQGHVNIFAHVEPGRWIYLAGDACHHPRILSGETEMATWEEIRQVVCIHQHKALAEDTVRRIKRAREEGLKGERVEVVLGHDKKWAERHREGFFPGCL